MKKFRWQILIILLTGLIVGLLLLIQKPQNQIFENKPTIGGIYTEAIVGSFQRFNPLLDHYNQADKDVDRLLFNGLVKFDAKGMPQPDLAESWGISKDGLVYNFSIRDNITWHDGVDFTVDDIIFTIDKMRDDASVLPGDLKAFWKNVKLTRLDDYNLQMRLPEPFAPFLDYLSFGVLPSHLLKDLSYEQIIDSTFNLQPVGTGPYQLDKLIVENDKVAGVSLKLNKNYFGGRAFIETIILRYYPDAGTAYQAFQNGQVQGISQVSIDILPSVLSQSNLSIYTSRKPELALVMLNLNDPEVKFLQNTVVRQALVKSINRSYIINRLLYGQAIPADSPILPDSWAYYSDSPIRFDAEGAVNELKNEGYIFAKEGDTVRSKDGEYLSFTLLYPDNPHHQAIAESIQKDWQAIGVEAKLEPLAYDQLIEQRLTKRKYQAALVDINLSRTPDPDPYPFWDQSQAVGGQNYSQWDNDSASEYIEQARVTSDYTERNRLYHNFQVVFRKEMPALLLYYPVYNYAVNNLVQGIQIGPIYDASDRFQNVTRWYMQVQKGGQSVQTAVP